MRALEAINKMTRKPLKPKLSYVEMLDIIQSGESHSRCRLANSEQSLPVEIVELLAHDDDPDVRYRVALYRKEPLSLGTIKALVYDGDSEVRDGLAHCAQKLPPAILRVLVHDIKPYVRQTVASYCKYLPIELLKILADDPDDYVKCHARRKLKTRLELNKYGL
jgi:hypothetical protein